MSVQIVLDVTKEYVSGSESGTPYLLKLDTGGFDYAVVQFIGLSQAITFKNTNDSGDIQSVSDGSAVSSANPIDLLGVNLKNGNTATSTAEDSIWRFQSYARYLWLDGTGETPASVTKLLVRLYKIH